LLKHNREVIRIVSVYNHVTEN